MELIVTYHAAVEALVAFTDMPRSLLHVHGGMIIYLGCQFLMGTRRGSLVAVVITVQLAMIHEVMNRIFYGSWRWGDTSEDLVLSMFWPAMCYFVSRFRRWQWAHRARLRAIESTSGEKQPPKLVAYS